VPGPAPKPASERRRRNAAPGTVRLPAEGRNGEPPAWPLRFMEDAEQAEREAGVWAELWATPQAVAWERLGAGTVRTVARYVRLLAVAELGSVPYAAEARQLEDRLGLTPMSMLRLRWEIVPDEMAEQRDARPVGRSATPRQRLRVVDPGAVAGS
jgi:hypothetical protein